MKKLLLLTALLASAALGQSTQPVLTPYGAWQFCVNLPSHAPPFVECTADIPWGMYLLSIHPQEGISSYKYSVSGYVLGTGEYMYIDGVADISAINAQGWITAFVNFGETMDMKTISIVVTPKPTSTRPAIGTARRPK